MKDQEKIEYFAAYLPYGVRLSTSVFHNELYPLTIEEGLFWNRGMTIQDSVNNNAKLILKPLHEVDLQDFVDENQFKMSDALYQYISAFDDDVSNQDVIVMSAPYIIFQWLLKNHYDVFGLIEKGIAVDWNEFKTKITK